MRWQDKSVPFEDLASVPAQNTFINRQRDKTDKTQYSSNSVNYYTNAMATLEELEETARLVSPSPFAAEPLTETQIDELRQTFGVRW